MHTKSEILNRMGLYRIEGGGIGSWLTERTSAAVFDRLGKINEQPLPAVQLNQLLVLAHEAPVSDGFYSYYWLAAPNCHPYDVHQLAGFQREWTKASAITSLDHLAWGLHRLYIDGLLYYGNVRTAFRALREMSRRDLQVFFESKRFDTDAIKRRGPSLPLRQIDKKQRYLISEMACKSYGDDAKIKSDLRVALINAYSACVAAGSPPSTVRELIQNYLPEQFSKVRDSLRFSASEILDNTPTSVPEVEQLYLELAGKFDDARNKALQNTEYYLSMLTDLDVYVATSMREPEDFVRMAETCESVFSDSRLRSMNLRYFDPTLSAANGHEDKGLIECLMVKCAKALVYCRGDKESYGKDAEAAMALSLGRPVIFYCEQRADFYRDVHPLTRLIEFQTGVAVGAMVTEKLDDVSELLCRTFENRMIYRLEQSDSGSLRLREDITGSVVRLQTSDPLLTETFWNHYHQSRNGRTTRPTASVLDYETARQSRDSGTRPPHLQGDLPFTQAPELVPLAARRPSQDRNEQPKERVIEITTKAVGAFPMTPAEVFDGIAGPKTTQATGAKRYSIFSQWLATERVGIIEVIRLLRFVNETLETHRARASYVYGTSDLTRWYTEMSNGEAVGSWR